MKKTLLIVLSSLCLLSCSEEEVVNPVYWQLIPNYNTLPLISIWENEDKIFFGGGSVGVEANEHLGAIMSFDGHELIKENVNWKSRSLVIGGASNDQTTYAIANLYDENQNHNDEILVYSNQEWVLLTQFDFHFITNVKNIQGEIYLTSSGGVYTIEDSELKNLNAPYLIHIMDIWGASSDNLYAVDYSGEEDFILHFDGEKWINMLSPGEFSSSFLTAIEGVSDNEIYAVGSNRFLRFDGEHWEEIAEDTKGYFDDLTVLGSRDVYLVSSEYPNYGAIHHYNGIELVQEFSTVTGINSIWNSPKHGLFAVGNDGLILNKPIR
ncbi:hypothetical protein WJR50_28250 [Catalinimonas sp. 4WD22]|uniref:hypothetical protein n=1 Tax=Catalinimonas locisalis TaxID=3133978 RepID=UPI0031016AB6